MNILALKEPFPLPKDRANNEWNRSMNFWRQIWNWRRIESQENQETVNNQATRLTEQQPSGSKEEIKRNQKKSKDSKMAPLPHQPRHLNKERRRDASPTSMKHYVASTLPFFPLIMATWRFTILQLSILDSILPDSSGFFQILLDAPRLVAALVLLPFLLPILSYQTPFRHIFSYFLPLFCVQTATTHSSNKALIKKPSYIGDQCRSNAENCELSIVSHAAPLERNTWNSQNSTLEINLNKIEIDFSEFYTSPYCSLVQNGENPNQSFCFWEGKRLRSGAR